MPRKYSVYTRILERIRMMREQLDRLEREVAPLENARLLKGPRLVEMRSEEVEEAARLYAAGYSMTQLSAHMGYSEPVLKKHLIDAGVHLRTRSKVQDEAWMSHTRRPS